MVSVSPIDGNSYSIPNGGDREGIDAFLQNNKGKKVVVVQGLGFVGAAMAMVVANAKEDYAVIGVDLPSEGSYWKIASINSGQMPLISSDEKLTQYFESAKERDCLYATYDEYAYSRADIVIVDINLDVDKKSDNKKEIVGFDVDLTYFKRAIRSVAENCKSDVLILVETTVPPGACEKVVKPILDEVYKKRGVIPGYKLAHSYERVMPGPNYIDSIVNFYRVYSGIDQDSADAAEVFLKSVIRTDEYPLTRLGNTTSTEMAKVLENSYRAMNIAFMQEWTEFSEVAGVDLYDVISAIRMRPTHKNIMRPGLGVGGYCLTKDPLLASWASQTLFDAGKLTQSEVAVQINDQMPLHTCQVLRRELGDNLEGKKVLVLGVSYLNDVGDTRYTPLELLYDELCSDGVDVHLHDPYVKVWEEKDLFIEQTLPDKHFDAIVVSIAHKQFISEEYISYINSLKPTILVDTLGCYLDNSEDFSKDINVITIGKGV